MNVKNFFHTLTLGILISSIAACGNAPSETSADSTAPAEKSAGLLDKLKPEPEPKITIPSGTRLRVLLIDGVSSNKSSSGDQFMASLADPVVINGKTVLAKGTKVRGRVVDANDSGRVKGRASIQLKLTDVVRNNAPDIAISTKTFSAVAEATKKRDAAIIGGGAGLGAAIGAIAGGGKGAAIGAAVGGGAGTGTVLATKGKEIHYPPETRLTFTLAQSVEI
jgi:hypothetical protein